MRPNCVSWCSRLCHSRARTDDRRRGGPELALPIPGYPSPSGVRGLRGLVAGELLGARRPLPLRREDAGPSEHDCCQKRPRDIRRRTPCATGATAFSIRGPAPASKPDGYLLGSYRIATAPESNSSLLTSFKSTCFDSPANNVGPWPASLGCTTNSYSSINPSSANASGSFTPPTNSPLPDSRFSC